MPKHNLNVDLKKMSSDDIYDYSFKKVSEKDLLQFIERVLVERPDADVNFVEMFENTSEYKNNRYDIILDFADRFRKSHPEQYKQQYEFVELKLTDHAFDTMNLGLIDRCMEVVCQNPAKGIDTVTWVTLYRLIYHGLYSRAVEYSKTVWEPIANGDKLVGYPEVPFIMTIYLDGVEKQYEKIALDDSSDWKRFMKKMEKLGFDNDKKRIDTIYHALSTKMEGETLIRRLKQDPEYVFIELLYHFMRHMKKRYNMPFMHSEILFGFIQSRKLLVTKKKDRGFFFVPYNHLDNYVAERYDAFLGSNQIELFGQVWGLHYVYEFLYENRLISDDDYGLMVENLTNLKKNFLAIMGSDAWKLKYVTLWPASEDNPVVLPDDFFENIDRLDYNNAVGYIRKMFPAEDK